MNKLVLDIGDAFNAPIRAGDPGPIISNLVRVVFVVAGTIILFMFVLGGFGMIAGAGNKSPEDAAKAKKTLTYAVIGFIVIFTSFWVIRFIEIVTDSTFITQPVL